MHTHGCAARCTLVSPLVVIIHYKTIVICYLYTNYFYHVIHYWYQFCNGVMVKDLWYRGEAANLTQDFAAWCMSVSRSLVMIHFGITLMCYLPLTFP
jgi:hypothetical protein